MVASMLGRREKESPGRLEPSTRVVTITPEIARALLAKSGGNRVLSPGRIDAYASVMRRREWSLNGEAIILDWNGNVQGGHHRLEACVKADVPFTTFLTEGVSPDAYLTLDIGKPQSVSDKLSREGIVNYKLIAAAGQLCKRYEERTVAGRRGVHDVVSGHAWCLLHHAALDHAVAEGRSVYLNFRTISATCISAALFEYNRFDPERADVFVEQVGKGTNLNETSAALQLRNKLINTKKAGLRIHQETEFAWILNAVAFDLRADDKKRAKKIRWWDTHSDFPYLYADNNATLDVDPDLY